MLRLTYKHAFLTASFAVALMASSAHAGTIVEETFGGTDGDPLNGETAETFASGITSAGGSGTWVAGGSTFEANGDVEATVSQNTAYLSLGTYINDAIGTATGKFELAATLSPTTASWVSLGFFSSSSPNADTNFTGNGGIATMIYRDNGEVDAWGGPSTANGVQGSLGLTGDQLFTIELDFTPGGGYDGSTNFGTVTFYEGTAILANSIGSFTYTSAQTFGALGMTEAGSSTGAVGGLTLSQVPEPTAICLLVISGVALVTTRRRRRS